MLRLNLIIKEMEAYTIHNIPKINNFKFKTDPKVVKIQKEMLNEFINKKWLSKHFWKVPGGHKVARNRKGDSIIVIQDPIWDRNWEMETVYGMKKTQVLKECSKNI